MPLARDILHPDPVKELERCKLKRLVQHPNSFMDVKCPGYNKITTVFRQGWRNGSLPCPPASFSSLAHRRLRSSHSLRLLLHLRSHPRSLDSLRQGSALAGRHRGSGVGDVEDKSGIQIDLPTRLDWLVFAVDFFNRMVNGALSLLDSTVESTGKLLHWIVELELPPPMEEEDVRGEDSLSDGSSTQQPPPMPEYVGGHDDEVLRTLSAAARQIEREQEEQKAAEEREAAATDEDDGELTKFAGSPTTSRSSGLPYSRSSLESSTGSTLSSMEAATAASIRAHFKKAGREEAAAEEEQEHHQVPQFMDGMNTF